MTLNTGVIEKLGAPGLSVTDFCTAEGVPAPRVYHLRRKLREAAEADADVEVAELTNGDRVWVLIARLPELVAA